MNQQDQLAPASPSATPRRHHPLLIAAALAGLGLLLLILAWDWNWFKAPIERRISAATGRSFHIDGELSVKLGWKPRITMEGLRLGNLPGNTEPQMASARSLQFRLHLKPLLFQRDWVLSEVAIAQPRLLLEKNRAEVPNWVFRDGGGEWPTIQHLSVDAGKLKYRNPSRKTDMDFDLRSGAPGKDARLAPLLVSGRGQYVGNTVELEGRVDSPLALRDNARPYHVDMRARAGATHATADGHLIAPLQLQGFDVEFGLRGPNLALIYPLTGIATPDTPPYRLLGRLTHEKSAWHYRKFNGVVGGSDLAGDASFLTGRERPKLVADLVSQRLDFKDLGGFLGRAPQAPQPTGPGVLPDTRFELEKIRSMDADVKLSARRIHTQRLPLDAMTARLMIDDGVLRLDPLDFKAAGGEIRSSIRMDARGPVIASRARVRAEGLSLPRLFPGFEATEDATGRLGGSLALTGSGNSVARMLASSDGDVSARMGSGRVSNLLMEKAGIDIQETVKFLLTKDRSIPVRCAFGEFDVKKGLMSSRALAFDTTDTVILGDGSISLRDERYDLRLKPLPKDRSFLSLRAPLRLTGTFKDPEFHPDMTRITLRAAAAVLLATIAPPAALIATFETGPGKDIACRPGERFADAQKKWTRP